MRTQIAAEDFVFNKFFLILLALYHKIDYDPSFFMLQLFHHYGNLLKLKRLWFLFESS
jgi:hypothetical protein